MTIINKIISIWKTLDLWTKEPPVPPFLKSVAILFFKWIKFSSVALVVALFFWILATIMSEPKNMETASDVKPKIKIEQKKKIVKVETVKANPVEKEKVVVKTLEQKPDYQRVLKELESLAKELKKNAKHSKQGKPEVWGRWSHLWNIRLNDLYKEELSKGPTGKILHPDFQVYFSLGVALAYLRNVWWEYDGKTGKHKMWWKEYKTELENGRAELKKR